MKSQNPKHADSQENSEYFPKSQEKPKSTRGDLSPKPEEIRTDSDSSKSRKNMTLTPDHTTSVRHH